MTEASTAELWNTMRSLATHGQGEAVALNLKDLHPVVVGEGRRLRVRREAVLVLATLSEQRLERVASGRIGPAQSATADRLSALVEEAQRCHQAAPVDPNLAARALANLRPLLPQAAADSTASDRTIFVSYRRTDSADVAGRIHDRLAEQFGKGSIFMDVDSIPLGVNYRNHIVGMLGRCKVCLVIMGPNWARLTGPDGRPRLQDEDDLVRIEVETALSLKSAPVVPLLVSGAAMPLEADLPPGLLELLDREGQPIRPNPDFNNDVDRLVARLRVYLG
jgi:hypothetical protein